MSGCTLRLSRDSPLRTILVDEATGQAKYKIDTPRKVGRSVTRISKFGPPPPQPPLHRDEDVDPAPSDVDVTNKGKKKVKSNSKKGKKGREGARDEAEAETELPETDDEIARIYWRWFSPHKIVFRGGMITRDHFLPKAGKMRGSYMFIGPDGVQYRWALGITGMHYPKLVTVDEKKAVVAEFHRAHYVRKKQKARLEIQPAGMDMLDHIILTFVFVEDKRRQREARATWDIAGVI